MKLAECAKLPFQSGSESQGLQPSARLLRRQANVAEVLGNGVDVGDFLVKIAKTFVEANILPICLVGFSSYFFILYHHCIMHA